MNIVYRIVIYHRIKYKCIDVLILYLPVYCLYFSIERWIYILWRKSCVLNLISTILLLSLFRYLSCGQLVPKCSTRPVVSDSALTWLIRYIFLYFQFLNNVIIINTKVILSHVLVTLVDLNPVSLLLPDFYIIWHSNNFAFSVPDKGYSKNGPCALNLISTYFSFHMLQKKTRQLF